MAAEVKEGGKMTKRMKVSVVVPRPRDPRASNGLKIVVLEVSSDDTVGSVKETLHAMEGIPPHRQRLEFARSALPDDDDTTLGDHGVVDSATIQLVETKMEVFVHCKHRSNGGTIAFSGIESSETVESFRLMIQERDGIPPRLQRLMYGGKHMDDGHTLADYGVREHATIQLLVRLIVNLRTREVELDIEVTDTVGRIKERVEEAEEVPVACQSVSYRGKDLDVSHALALNGRALLWVNIECRRQEKEAATKTTNKGEKLIGVAKKTVKRLADVEVTDPGKKIKKSKRIKQKPLAETEREPAEIPAVQRRRLTVFLIGPELAPICPSSCDKDPAAC